jgi:hypothetical protein
MRLTGCEVDPGFTSFVFFSAFTAHFFTPLLGGRTHIKNLIVRIHTVSSKNYHPKLSAIYSSISTIHTQR